MSRTAFTPGPWTATPSQPPEGVECYWLRADREIGSIDGPQSNEQQANARLIAAAPEMYQALKAMLELHEAHHNQPIHAQARAVLAKARGEA